MKKAFNVFFGFKKYIIFREIYEIFGFAAFCQKLKENIFLFYPYKYLEKRISYVSDFLNYVFSEIFLLKSTFLSSFRTDFKVKY